MSLLTIPLTTSKHAATLEWNSLLFIATASLLTTTHHMASVQPLPLLKQSKASCRVLVLSPIAEFLMMGGQHGCHNSQEIVGSSGPLHVAEKGDSPIQL